MSAAATERRNPLLELLEHGQSAWYDYIRRGLIESGELQRLIAEDGLRGVTSNPSIWEKAIAGSSDYDAAIARLVAGGERDAGAIYEVLAIEDVRAAADALRPIYDETGGGDGYVSIEVSPANAHDTDATLAEAEHLWEAIDRENLMVKVPATPAGIPAVRTLIARGINVNITLLFALPVYEQVAEAYLAGLEDLAREGGDVARVGSVASFFVSRIDTPVDARLEEIAADDAADARRRALARGLAGKVAIVNAKLAYQHFKGSVQSERWRALAARGAHPQRLLWASTLTKNPRYPELMYVEELIGQDTVDTVPPATFDAFREHGNVRDSLEDDVDGARETIAALEELGISLPEITDRLTVDGIALFSEAFDKLFAAIEQNVGAPTGALHRASLPPALQADVESVLDGWQEGAKVRRLWSRDATLWTGGDEARWLGWLDVAHDQLAHAERFAALLDDVRGAGFSHALVLGMGGSSLFPELLALTFGAREGFPALRVLDSTDPAQVRAAEESVDLERTLFVVSSKSGTTLEPNILMEHFLLRAREIVGEEEAPRRFMAITDPASQLDELARERGFRHVAHGRPSIGGRYSALSDFGMVPGAIAGVEIHELLDRAERMAHACMECVPARENPGLALGATIGACALAGRDKLTLVASPAIGDLGAWLEQLLAESTGKQGHGVIPVDREPLGSPEAYGEDRLFAYVRLASEPDPAQDAALDAIEAAGHPVVRIEIGERLDLGGEVFRWEFATAVAGAVIGIDPFDQPDVEAAKVATRELTAAYEKTGELRVTEPERDLDAALARFVADLAPGDYAALLAYVPMTAEHERALSEIRTAIRDGRRVATCVGFGPRFLHSTGQAYKGGPNSGVFLQITGDDALDVPVPGRRYSFGVVEAAQAAGDLAVLRERGRRIHAVHIGEDVEAGLRAIGDAARRALG